MVLNKPHKIYKIGLTEESWKLYAQFIKDNHNTFKEICEKEIIPGDPLITGRKLITHQNPEMNFNLPVDMGGIGYLYNHERYSRVNTIDKFIIGKLLES